MHRLVYASGWTLLGAFWVLRGVSGTSWRSKVRNGEWSKSLRKLRSVRLPEWRNGDISGSKVTTRWSHRRNFHPRSNKYLNREHWPAFCLKSWIRHRKWILDPNYRTTLCRWRTRYWTIISKRKTNRKGSIRKRTRSIGRSMGWTMHATVWTHRCWGLCRAFSWPMGRGWVPQALWDAQ